VDDVIIESPAEPKAKKTKTVKVQAKDVREIASAKRQAIHDAISDKEIKAAILDLYNSAMATQNPYAKAALFRIFFEQVVGTPPVQKEVKQTTVAVQQTIDYSQLTAQELQVLEAVGYKMLAHSDTQAAV
jgi:hypothetical protein